MAQLLWLSPCEDLALSQGTPFQLRAHRSNQVDLKEIFEPPLNKDQLQIPRGKRQASDGVRISPMWRRARLGPCFFQKESGARSRGYTRKRAWPVSGCEISPSSDRDGGGGLQGRQRAMSFWNWTTKVAGHM